jgi:transposase-like protein
VTGETILSRSNDPVPVETRLQIVLAVMSGEITIAEAARRHGVSTESINRWRNRFVDAGKAAMEDGMPGGKGAGRGNFVERRRVPVTVPFRTQHPLGAVVNRPSVWSDR